MRADRAVARRPDAAPTRASPPKRAKKITAFFDRPPPPADATALARLVEMGFSATRARAALDAAQGDAARALERLLAAPD